MKQQQRNKETTRPKNKRRPRIRKNKEITIATINVRGVKGKIHSLETTLNTEKISIALITETQLKKGNKYQSKDTDGSTDQDQTAKEEVLEF